MDDDELFVVFPDPEGFRELLGPEPAQVLVMPFNGGFGGPVDRVPVDVDGRLAEIAVPCVIERLSDRTDPTFVVWGEPETITRVKVEEAGDFLRLKSDVLPDGLTSVAREAFDLPVGMSAALASRGMPSDVIGLLLTEASPRVVWINPGGRHAWVVERLALRDAALLRHEAAVAARLQAQFEGKFINPYTFVPLPVSVTRKSPRGHASLRFGGSETPDGLSGWFDVDFTFATPYLLPQGSEHRDGEILRISGSSVRGSVRSIHEVLAGGCLRIVDADLVPAYREPLAAFQPSSHRLALVESIDPATGAVTSLQVCDRVVWVPVLAIHPTVDPAHLCSGSRIEVRAAAGSDPGETSGVGRIELAAGDTVTTGDGWVVHLTAIGSRKADETFFAAVGRLSRTLLPLENGVWEAFQQASAGTDDTRLAAANGAAPTHHPWADPAWPGASVRHKNAPVGQRRRADGWLGVGDTVWVTGNGPKMRLKMAAVWRTTGTHRVSDRLAVHHKSSLLPCTTSESLCPSCAVFGSIDPASDRSAAVQEAYGAHMRVGPALSLQPVTAAVVPLPPLLGPRPGSGAFYLQHPQGANLAPDRKRPKTQWGAALDHPTPRDLAGRKFYWHGQAPDTTPFPRHLRRGDAEGIARDGRVVASGTVVRSRIWFDNLDETQLGLLLGAAEPGLVLAGIDAGDRLLTGQARTGSRVFSTHLGGGKPLGYGTAQPQVVAGSLVVHTAASRYLAADITERDPATLAAEARRVVLSSLGDEEPETWRALASVLTQDRVNAEHIWYPTEVSLDARVRPNGDFNDRVDEGFRFFVRYAGGGQGRTDPMQVLPLATARWQYLPAEE